MRTLQRNTTLWVALVAAAGCRIASHVPNPQWLADFESADTIAIRKHKQQMAVTDADTIKRLKTIYANARWKPYWHTLPGNLDDRQIDLLDGEKRLRHFSYTTGTLWETESYSDNRTAELSESDRQWIESLFTAVPDAEALPDSETAK